MLGRRFRRERFVHTYSWRGARAFAAAQQCVAARLGTPRRVTREAAVRLHRRVAATLASNRLDVHLLQAHDATAASMNTYAALCGIAMPCH